MGKEGIIASWLAKLTPREKEVLELVSEGYTSAGIASSLTLTVGSVKQYIDNIYKKLEDAGYHFKGKNKRTTVTELYKTSVVPVASRSEDGHVSGEVLGLGSLGSSDRQEFLADAVEQVPNEQSSQAQIEIEGKSGRRKIPTTLVERPRQEPWWHGEDVIFPVPDYSEPTVLGSRIAVSLKNLVYCLDANFGYAKAWEFNLHTPVAFISSPRLWGDHEVALTTLLADGRYQVIMKNLNSGRIFRRTLIKGRPYHPGAIFEDRYPISPVSSEHDIALISPYGHVVALDARTLKKRSIGRNIRVRYQPGIFGQTVVFHVDNDKQAWLEWWTIDTLEKVASSKKFPTRLGISTGYVGTDPLLNEEGVVCGLGDRLIYFSNDGNIVWQLIYPCIELIRDDQPLQVVGPDGEVLYETTSEVAVTSNLYRSEGHLYFVLSECTRHISFLTKVDMVTGKVIWPYRIEGFSHGFAIISVSERGLLLQNGTWLWTVAQDGSLRNELQLDVDCASCSKLVQLGGDKYVFLADLGLHEVRIGL